MTPRALPLLALLLALALAPACAFHTTAREWNGLEGAAGEPVWYTATTKVALNLFVAVPFLGRAGVDGMIDDLTEEIQLRGGDDVRIVQGSRENYWHGFPPLTWIFTPVIAHVHAEWRPHPVLLADWASRCTEDDIRRNGKVGLGG